MPHQTAALIAEGVLLLAGLALGFAWLTRPALRARFGPGSLAPWDIRAADFFLFLLLAIGGGLALQVAALGLLARSALGPDWQLIAAGGAFQAGMLAGIGAFRAFFDPASPTQRGVPALPRVGGFAALTGSAAFLVSIPVLAAGALAWQGLLNLAGLPVEKQDLLGLFANARSPWLRGALVFLAVGVAPLTEEMIFRGGLFRYLRTRVPRWAALLGPSLLFGALHVDWKTLSGLAAFGPLVILGIVFSLAYEHTNRIETTIVAHALFNLNTILLVLAGVSV
jgi:membrane protease YdiL (CAAX protease family)